MSTKSKYTLPIAIGGSVLVFLLIYFFVFREGWKEVGAKWKSLNTKQYTINAEVSVGGNTLSLPPKERAKQLQEVNAILLKRLWDSGNSVRESSVDENTGTLSYSLTGVTNPENVEWLLSHQGNIAFYHTYEAVEVMGYLNDVNQILADILEKQKNAEGKVNAQEESVSIGDQIFADLVPDSAEKERVLREAKKESAAPLYEILQPNVNGGISSSSSVTGEGAVVGVALIKDTAKINSYLSYPEVKKHLPDDLQLKWGAQAFGEQKTAIFLYAIQQPFQLTEPPLSGKYIKEAVATLSNNSPDVSFSFSARGSATWERMTRQACTAELYGKRVYKCIAIVLDDKVFSAPQVRSPITGGKSQITGIESMEEARNLAIVLNSGELLVPVSLKNLSVK